MFPLKRTLAAFLVIGCAHRLFVTFVVFLSGFPVFANLYLGVFGSSPRIGSFFTLVLEPVFWLVAAVHPESLHNLSPAARMLYPILSSILYGASGAATLIIRRAFGDQCRFADRTLKQPAHHR